VTDFSGLEISAVNDDVVVENDTPGKGVCPDCNKLLTITSEGVLRKHKCVNDISTATTAKDHGSRVKRPRTPAAVRNLGVAVLAGGIEYATAASVSRWAECDPREVPADLGNQADIMIGPFLDAAWPRIPKEAQRVIKTVADESDVLVAVMAWWEYGTNLRKWAEQKKVLVENEATPTKGYQDVPVSFSPNGDGIFGSIQGFTPDPVSP
jgi:hypothetical protein